jgi:transcriptional regulator with XRE-family HTH domain
MKVFSPEDLKKARSEAGLTQFGLGSRSGIAPAKISQFENGRTTPSLVSAAALAGALGLLVDDFLKEVD